MGARDDERQLCPDGGCIGLIGPDGVCKECGLAADAGVDEGDDEGDEREAPETDEELDDEDDLDDEELDDDLDDEEDDLDDEELEDDLDDEEDDLDDEELDDEEDDLDDDKNAADLELAHRELCPSGDCIGLIGADGRCKECGTPGRSARLDPRQRGMLTETEMEEDVDEGALKSLPGSAPDFASRQLCPDGACIGVIGPDGRCKECGKAASKQ